MQEKTEAAIQAAYKAGKLLRERFRTKFLIREKAPTNLVTELDLACEEIIVTHLFGAFPSIAVLTEESDSTTSRDTVERWIVDPLDATTNYAHGYPCYAVSIALEVDGHVEAGVVYDPSLDELYVAERGMGAFLNGEPIRVSNTVKLGDSLIGSGFPYYAWGDPNNNSKEWAALIQKTTSLRCDGSAALDLCRVASGNLDGYWEMDLEPWDMAAGVLIVTEAGGRVSLADGRPFSLFQRTVLATNPGLYEELLSELKSNAFT